MALDTVQDYVDRARVLLLDETTPYRYSDDSLVEALNLAILEMRRIRPDAMMSYFRTSLPSYTSASLSDTVAIDEQLRVAALYYVCGHAHLRDEEDTQDTRATAFLNKFTAQLLTIAS
jgi:hypothetical protein